MRQKEMIRRKLINVALETWFINFSIKKTVESVTILRSVTVQRSTVEQKKIKNSRTRFILKHSLSIRR